MNDNVNKARSIATDALSQSSRGGSIESLVRAALRVSALLKHPYMRAWCEMQLQDTTAAVKGGKGPELRGRMEEMFPNDVASAISRRVLFDYAETRKSTVLGEERLYGGSLSELEHIHATGVKDSAKRTPPAVVFDSINEQRTMLQGIKERTERYLVAVESGEVGADPLQDDEAEPSSE